ncbi:acyclic terpene utilization AtuA family protein [Rhodococcus qingshengii]|uniref:acyclic terpene utilization AtuA family protein n=1 Tax=Rhodococcus qingshengii TaxID=334542 RepID=UPI001ABF2F37|nr:acyclic terpene utilization AtuA family protein [Rhodococcus qingshengii]
MTGTARHLTTAEDLSPAPAADRRIVRIGGSSGFWGDSRLGPDQLANSPELDYIVGDYLAELTMSILTAARVKDPEMGYATDFVSAVRDILPRCKRNGTRIVSNAGGLNPGGCARAVERIASELGLTIRVAVIEGDNALSHVDELRAQGIRDFYTGEPLPEHLMSANAYLGATAIRDALANGADIVITGRVVDSALVLGPLMHEFSWSEDDYDLLAAGSLAGHLIECGAQATGGLHTDWRTVPDWANIGYPIVECSANGTFVVTKPHGTGGLVTPAVLAEQMLYEIGDPARYVLPDVVCDFTGVHMQQVGQNRVRVDRALGRRPTDSYKVAATYVDGYRVVATLTIVGFEASAKAERTGEALLERGRRIFQDSKLGNFTATRIDVFDGAGSATHTYSEAVLRVSVAHPNRKALSIFASEVAAAATSWSTGTIGSIVPGRPTVSPLVKLSTFLIPKDSVQPVIVVDGETQNAHLPLHTSKPNSDSLIPQDPAVQDPILTPSENDTSVELPLIQVAYARSGDKGPDCNVGIIARSATLYPYLVQQLTSESLARKLDGIAAGGIERYLVPGIRGLNFVLKDSLGGGGMRSMLPDPLGKSMAQRVLALKISIPARLLDTHLAHALEDSPFLGTS